MRAIVLLLVLMGMAEVGWGQEIERDTICEDESLKYVKVKRHYERYFPAVHMKNGIRPPLYNLCHSFGLNGGGGGFAYGYLYFKNTELAKVYKIPNAQLHCFFRFSKNIYGLRIKSIGKFSGLTEMYNDIGMSDEYYLRSGSLLGLEYNRVV